MLTELCQELHNWFDRKPDGSKYPKYNGVFTVSGGVIAELDGKIADGQYFRIMGSLFNDGVHRYGDEDDVLTDEVFEGAVWSMGVPPEIIALSDEIDEWKKGNGKNINNPISSENLTASGYSWSSKSIDDISKSNWQAVFRASLTSWRKI